MTRLLSALLSVNGLRHACRLLGQGGQRRHLGAWAASLRQDPPASGIPWLTFDAVRFLERRLPPRPRVLEYGSGGSTGFWLRRGARCVSIEHDPGYFDAIRGALGEAAELDYRLILPEPAPAEPGQDAADPGQYRSSDPRFRDFTFRRYAAQADGFPDGHFDAVLVDGRARPSCILHAAPKVKPGGLLILDDADRPHYLASAAFLQAFDRHAFPGATPFGAWLGHTDVHVRRGPA